MSDQPKTVFVTKYALSGGIQKLKAQTTGSDQWIEVWMGPHKGWCPIEVGYAFDTREAAVARAEQMRKARIASYERSIAKLRAMKF